MRSKEHLQNLVNMLEKDVERMSKLLDEGKLTSVSAINDLHETIGLLDELEFELHTMITITR